MAEVDVWQRTLVTLSSSANVSTGKLEARRESSSVPRRREVFPEDEARHPCATTALAFVVSTRRFPRYHLELKARGKVLRKGKG